MADPDKINLDNIIARLLEGIKMQIIEILFAIHDLFMLRLTICKTYLIVRFPDFSHNSESIESIHESSLVNKTFYIAFNSFPKQ